VMLTKVTERLYKSLSIGEARMRVEGACTW